MSNINVNSVKVGMRTAYKMGNGTVLSMAKFLKLNQRYIVIQLKTSKDKTDRTFILITEVNAKGDFDTNKTNDDYNKILSELIKGIDEHGIIETDKDDGFLLE